MVRPGVEDIVVLEVGLPGPKGQSSKLKTAQTFLLKSGFRTRLLAAFANTSLVNSVANTLDALGANDMPNLGTSFRSLKFSHMYSWDVWEVLTINAKALLLLAWAAWGLLRLQFPFSFSHYIHSLLFIGNSSPLELFWKGTAALSVGPLLLFQEMGSLLHRMGSLPEGQSFVVRGIDMIMLMAVIGTSFVVIGLVRRTGQLEAALAASQADVQAMKPRLVQQESVHSASKADMKTAAKQHRKLTQQQASLRSSLRRSNQQKAALQQKAVQLQQVSQSLQEMGCSMQQTHADMSKEVQLVRAELRKLQGEVAAVRRQAESSHIKAGPGEEAEVAVGSTSMKLQTTERAQGPQRRLLSEGLFVENPYSPSFSGSFTTSFSPGVTRNKGVDNGQRMSLLATIPASAMTISPNVQSENQETFKTRKPALVKADSKLGRLLSRFKQGS